jgi:cytosol alanyl aminopeptidase
VGLLGDVKALVAAGRFPAGEGMELGRRFAAARERQTVEGAIGLGEIPEDFLEGAAAKAYPAWVRKHFGPRARALGLQARPGEDEDTRLLRLHLVAFVADKGQDPQLIAAAKNVAERWLKDPTSVDPDVVGTALTIAGTFGDAKLHDTLVQRMKTTQDRATRSRVLTALGAFRQPSLVKANLALVLAAPIDARELARLLYGASLFPAGRELVLQAMGAHFDAFAAQRPGRAVADFFELAKDFCDAKHRGEVEETFGPRADKVLGGKRELAQTLEAIDVCTANRALQMPSIAAYLTGSPHAARGHAGSGPP